MKILEKVESSIQKIDDPSLFLEKWEVLIWIMEKIRLGQFDDLVSKLPKALILSLEGGVAGNRVIISKVTDKEYKILSVGIKDRHPAERIFSLEQIPPPMETLLKGKEKSILITDPINDPLTQYMRGLVENEKINTIYYTMVQTFYGTWFIVVDSTGTKRGISNEEKNFLDAISEKIMIAENEKRETEKNFEKSKKQTTLYLLGLFVKIFQDNIMAIGGLSRRLHKTASQKNGGACEKCFQKSHAIKTEAEKINKIIKIFQEAIHDISMANQMNYSEISFSEIIQQLAVSDISANVRVDKRKVEKFLNRIPPFKKCEFSEKDNFVKISFSVNEESKKTWERVLFRKKKGEINPYTPEDFLLLISVMLFKEMEGIIKIQEDKILLYFKKA